MDKEENQLIAQRKQKLKNILDQGINPYPNKYKKTHSTLEILTENKKLKQGEKSKKKVSIAGRIMTQRIMGKASFAHIQDESGKIQIFATQDDLKNYKLFKKLDIGDIIGCQGIIFKTKKGEISVWLKSFTLLTKSLRPLPEKWHGLKDSETKYRQRYLDLISNPEVRELFKKRTQFMNCFREYLDKNNFLEVETNTLKFKTGGAEAKPFKTHHNSLDIDAYLRISLELPLKRLMVGGYENIYEMAKVFRNEGMSTEHLQEFTMLEFYWAWHDYEDLMKFVEKMYKEAIKKTFKTLKIKYQNITLDFAKKWPKHDYVEIVKKKTGIDLLKENTKEKLIDAIKKKKLTKDVDLNGGLGRVTDQLYKRYVRPTLIQPCFLINHPVSISPLSKRMEKNPFLTERFQILAAGSEVGNGFSELNDPIDQKERLLEQQKMRDSGDDEAQMMDKDFIIALEHGMPPTAGYGVGIDRLFMILSNSESIRDVVFFPLMRPE
ncbi:MAG: lysine--tRNA ligase [Nanoarchaeota archaeon]|nr:lysine--tRNA ligase [Nanoarchaeota archaeon]MBU1444852.1 lysine--tRNA ligase [Nanoarchaeota archaeon]MBU2406718.1 lysine--tRNA ligase [Nanoarchaeota archaeon]MBU2420317.1 lysine--tRNA ligase [Nanoarchaeota archaeon]MBU2475286.1 lysine--tRNA ligase [Nanoarchaeota archaeon]